MTAWTLEVAFAVHDAGPVDDLPLVIAALRSAALAWEQQYLAPSDDAGGVLLRRKVGTLLEIADDLEQALDASLEELSAHWRQERRERHRAEREQA